MGRQFRIIKYRKETPRIPVAYQEVEYLESSGTQYIDTGIAPTKDTKIVYDFQYPSIIDGILGGTNINGSEPASLNLSRIHSQNFVYRLCYNSPISESADTSKHNVIFNDNGTLIVDNIYKGTFINRGSYENSLNLYLFAVNSSNVATSFASCRIFNMKIYSNQIELVRDLIPCYRKSDSVAGMYDIVNNVFYENAGSDSFVVGPDVLNYKWIEALVQQVDSIGHMLPAGYQEVEYLQSTGTQYLDSGVKPSATIGVDCDIYYKEINVENMALGVSTEGAYVSGKNYVLDAYQNKLMMAFGQGSASHASSGKQIISGIRYHITMNLNGDKSIYCDEVLQTTNNNPLNFPDYNIFIFGRSIKGTKDNSAAYIFKGRFYSLKMYDGATLIRNFIPCYRLSDSKPGMYDLVNNVFYINQATGTDFSVGPDIHTTPKFRVIETYKED